MLAIEWEACRLHASTYRPLVLWGGQRVVHKVVNIHPTGQRLREQDPAVVAKHADHLSKNGREITSRGHDLAVVQGMLRDHEVVLRALEGQRLRAAKISERHERPLRQRGVDVEKRGSRFPCLHRMRLAVGWPPVRSVAAAGPVAIAKAPAPRSIACRVQAMSSHGRIHLLQIQERVRFATSELEYKLSLASFARWAERHL